MRQLLISLLKRLPLLGGLLAGAIACWMQAERAGGIGAFPWVAFTVALFAVMGMVAGWPFAAFFAIPFERIYFPHTEERPKPAYPLAEWYLDQHRFEEALAEYEKILQPQPRELVARCIQIELLVARFDDPQAARKSVRRGRKLLRREADREALTEAYHRACEKVSAEEAA